MDGSHHPDKNPQIENNLIYMENVLVHYDEVVALNKVHLTVGRHEVVGILGDNGAGKSTLAHVLIGYKRITSGEIYFDGHYVQFKSPMEARLAGIETAYQDLALVDTLSISRNFFLGREIVKTIGPFKILDRKKMDQITSSYLEEIKLAPRQAVHDKVSSLSIGQRRSVAIGRANFFGAKLLILDEPLAGLSEEEAELVLSLVKTARNKGLSVIFITHNAHEVFEVADRFIVLNNGMNYAELSKEDTDYKELEKLLISSKLTAVREMTAGVAHQIRNPLAVMKVSAEMLRDDFRVATNQENYQRITGMLINEIETLNILVRNFLDFARPPKIYKTLCTIEEVIQAAIDNLPLEDFPEIKVVVHTQENIPPYSMDKNLMMQVISNLVLNSLQASSTNRRVEIRSFMKDNALCLEVADWGCGIDEDTKKRMFLPFFTTKTTGTGFGLPIVQRIIERHHGTIEVDSKPSEGTTFRIIL